MMIRCLSILLFFTSIEVCWSGLNVRDEITVTRAQMHGQSPSSYPHEVLKRYLISLKILEYQEQDPALKLELEIDEELKLRLLQAFTKMDSIFSPQFPVHSLFKLVRYIEGHRREWAEGAPIIPFIMLDESGKSIEVPIKMDSVSGIRFELLSDFVVNWGATKVARPQIFYPEWTKRAKITLGAWANQNSLIRFRNELKILKDLSDLVDNDRVGIVAAIPYAHGYVAPWYPVDLWKAHMRSKSLQSLDIRERLHLISQLSTGVAKLHSRELCHGDLKLENTLLDISDGARAVDTPHLVITDFDASFYPRALLRSLLPKGGRGTPLYWPPEAFDRGWIGSDDEERVENALKFDVFPMASLALFILEPQDVTWVLSCSDVEKKEGRLALQKCQTEKLDRFLKEVAPYKTGHDLYPALYSLFAKALQPDPTQRITSAQFHEELLQIILKSTLKPNDSL